MQGMFPLVPGLPGGPELIIVLFVLVLLFGANKIPKLARSTGEAMGEFKKGRQEVEQELEEIQEGTDEGGMGLGEETADTASDTADSTETETSSN